MLSARDSVAVVNRLHAAEPDRHGMKGLVSLLSRRGEHIVSLYEASSVYDLPDVAVDGRRGRGSSITGCALCSGWRKFCAAAAGRNAPGCNGWICAGRERWRIWLWNGEFHGKKPSPGLVTWPFPGNGKWSCARQPFICIRKDLTRKRLRRNLRSIFPDPG